MKKGLILIFCLAGVVSWLSCTSKKRLEEKVTLRYAAYSYQEYDKFRGEEARKFEKVHPGVRVCYEPIPGDYTAKILTELASNTAPDLFFVPRDYPQDLAAKGVLFDLTPFVEKDKSFFDEIYPQLIEAQEYKGRIYALPNNANLTVLFYNKRLFNESNLPYPSEDWTWEDMLQSAQKLTRVDERGAVTQFGLVPAHYNIFIIQNGGRFWDEDNTRCLLNSPEVIEALQFYRDLFYKYRVSPSPQYENQQLGRVELFTSGRLAMLEGGRWLTATFQIKKREELDWAIAPLPRGKRRATSLNYNCFGVWAKSKHPELAFELAKFMIRPEGIKFLVEVGDSIPIRLRGETVDFFLNQPGRPSGENQIYLDIFKYAFTIPSLISNPRISYDRQDEIVRRNIEYFMVGQMSAQEAVKAIENELNKLLAGE